MNILRHIPRTEARREHIAHKATIRFQLSWAMGSDIEVTDHQVALQTVEERIELFGLPDDTAECLREETAVALRRGPKFKRNVLLIGVDQDLDNAEAMFI